MKEINLLVWLTQLGLGVAMPMAGSVYLGIWLRERFELGVWVMLCCIGMGLACAVGSLLSSLKAMERMSKSSKEKIPPPVSFNKHQ